MEVTTVIGLAGRARGSFRLVVTGIRRSCSNLISSRAIARFPAQRRHSQIDRRGCRGYCLRLHGVTLRLLLCGFPLRRCFGFIGGKGGKFHGWV